MMFSVGTLANVDQMAVVSLIERRFGWYSTQYTFLRNGTSTRRSFDGDSYFTDVFDLTGTWVSSGARPAVGDEYEIKFNDIKFPAASTDWQVLNSARGFTVYETPSNNSNQFLVQIRRVGTTDVLASAYFYS
ncbi:MAG: hypothetical protein J0I01_05615 [Stenotrophomonas nitritireducens]|uniref:hypothetical protein n=1 Tax=Stenotrophomonas nitritireducens TaxID=83617 RepID=UPI001AD0C94F|nr:hypothetical protein [Stenotrophomonas nitritireducens]MBN8791689.1 hypothetical protein [Stenotrophomonas nitritireducens]MBN8795627.1 hypothetical protein [Stenotrophomonas nitritireducens]